jgi:glutamine synthetase
LRSSEMFGKAFGAGFVDYYAHIKEAELARFNAEATNGSEVTAWEQNEYFDLF